MIPPLRSHLENSQKRNAEGQKALVLMVAYGCVKVTSFGKGSCLKKEEFPREGES